MLVCFICIMERKDNDCQRGHCITEMKRTESISCKKIRNGFLRFIRNVVAYVHSAVAIFVRLLRNTLASIQTELEIKKLI